MKKTLKVNSGTPGLLPFLEEAITREIVVPGEYYEITQVHESRKRTGYLCKAKNFQIFLWKSDPICDVLLETLTELCSINPGQALFIILSEETVEGFEFSLDDVEVRMWVKGKKNNILTAYNAVPLSNTPEARATMKKRER